MPSVASALECLTEQIHTISGLPRVAGQVLNIINNADSSASDLAHLINQDHTIVARLIKAANSAAYSPRTPVTTTLHAVMFLGFLETRNLVLTMALQDLCAADLTLGPYSRRALWKHAHSVALATQMIAARRNLPDFNDAYLAGLFHDLGITLLDQHAHHAFTAIIAALTPNTSLLNTERHHLGFTHQDLGAAIAQSWRLPPASIHAIRYHHNPAEHRGPAQTIVHAVHLADCLCNLKGIAPIANRQPEPPLPDTLRALSLTPYHLAVLCADLDPVLQQVDRPTINPIA
jgi:HD-like signal output (HDOD) protein